jgi:hypothetical protein
MTNDQITDLNQIPMPYRNAVLVEYNRLEKGVLEQRKTSVESIQERKEGNQ